MATWINWSAIQNNQVQLSGQVLDINGKAVDLTNYTLSLVIKATQLATDASGTTYTPTITTAILGKWSLTLPGSTFPSPVSQWYRIDVVDNLANHVTTVLGQMTVLAA